MTVEQIYVIFERGIDFGIKNGIFPEECLFNEFELITHDIPRKRKVVLYTVIVAGFNYGSNCRSVKPDDKYIRTMFNNLINGLPLEPDDNMYYDIKEKIQKLL